MRKRLSFVRRIAGAATAALALFLSTQTLAQEAKLPPRAEAIRQFLLHTDYPEKFGETTYRIKVENMLFADLDGDGQVEAILHFFPHFRQSATIGIYRFAADMSVSRVTEGLAPGPLVPITGDFLDSHVLADAADISVAGEHNDATKRRSLGKTVLEHFGGVVEYADFFHVDMRSGAGYYIDMSHVEVKPDDKTCESFEFSPVRQIVSGAIPGLAKSTLLAAWVGAEIWFYQISGFTADGFLDKKLWVAKIPDDFQELAKSAAGQLGYVSRSGQIHPIDLRCPEGDNHCTIDSKTAAED